MQVDFKALTASSKEISLTIEAEKVSKAWDKYLKKAVKYVDVPGFRRGKAPLSIVERKFGERMKEGFEQEQFEAYFEEAVKEQNIEFLGYPIVKDIKWENGQDMVLTVEIEHEPIIEFKQLENLEVTHSPLVLEEETEKYLEKLVQDSGRLMEAEVVGEEDTVDIELSVQVDGQTHTKEIKDLDESSGTLFPDFHLLKGLKIGDVVQSELKGKDLYGAHLDLGIPLEDEKTYSVSYMINAVRRMEYPNLDDDFARDLEFESISEMRTKVAEEMRLKNEHMNIEIDHGAIVSTLFVDNKFELPVRAIKLLVEQNMESYPKDYKEYMEYYLTMQLTQQFITIYILQNLRRLMPMEITPEMLDEYYTHNAILEELTLEAYKNKHKDEIKEEEDKEMAHSYFILKKLAKTATFSLPKPAEEKPLETVSEEEVPTEAETSEPAQKAQAEKGSEN